MTSGKPRFREEGDTFILENQLIGRGFHWERAIRSILPGKVELTGDKDFPLINILDIEVYLQCVVGSEMNPDAPIEFLKAHAIISRSWAAGKVLKCHQMSNEGKRITDDEIKSWEDTADHIGFDVCSDDHCQRYQGIQPLSERARDAILSTSGMILTDTEGNLIDARFSKCCGGRTERFDTCWQDTNPPSLISREDPWCDLSDMSDPDREKLLRSVLKEYDRSTQGGHTWEANLTGEEIADFIRVKFGHDTGKILDLIPLERGASGRIKLMKFVGEKKSLTIGKELMIRKALSPSHLYSSWFDLTPTEAGNFLLSGHGWGHGVGLCQVGAARMATAGHSAEEILTFYYPGAQITDLRTLTCPVLTP